MAVKMGEDISWDVVNAIGGDNGPVSPDRMYFYSMENDLKLSAVRTAPYKYDVTVKINQLSFLWNQMVKTGQMYICLARKKWGRRHVLQSRIGNNRTAYYGTHFIPYTTPANLLGYSNVITPCLYKVIRGKNKYVFHIDFTQYIGEIRSNKAYGAQWNHTERPLAHAIKKGKTPYLDLCGYFFRIGTSKSEGAGGADRLASFYQPNWLTQDPNDTNTYKYDQQSVSLYLGQNSGKNTNNIRLEII